MPNNRLDGDSTAIFRSKGKSCMLKASNALFG
jgi:hypothetical protein